MLDDNEKELRQRICSHWPGAVSLEKQLLMIRRFSSSNLSARDKFVAEERGAGE